MIATCTADIESSDASLNVPERERRLLKATAAVSGQPIVDVLQCAQALSGDLDTGHHFQSKLNNDGSPLQLCISCSNEGVRYRLLADPHSHLKIRKERLARARETVFAHVGVAAALSRTLDTIIEHALPQSIDQEPAYEAGALWLGSELGSNAMAVYVNAAWGPYDVRWGRAIALVESLTKQPACNTLANCSRTTTTLASIGVEGGANSTGRLKLYFRAREAFPLQACGLSEDMTRSLIEVMAVILGESAIVNSGLLFCVGIDAASGEFVDFKIDVCGHCLAWNPLQLKNQARRLATNLHVDLPLLDELQIGQWTDLAFVGVAIDRHGSPRLNLYLKGAS